MMMMVAGAEQNGHVHNCVKLTTRPPGAQYTPPVQQISSPPILLQRVAADEFGMEQRRRHAGLESLLLVERVYGRRLLNSWQVQAADDRHRDDGTAAGRELHR